MSPVRPSRTVCILTLCPVRPRKDTRKNTVLLRASRVRSAGSGRAMVRLWRHCPAVLAGRSKWRSELADVQKNIGQMGPAFQKQAEEFEPD